MMIPVVLTSLFKVLSTITLLVYMYIGKNLNQSVLAWAFLAVGALFFLPLISCPVLYWGKNIKPAFMLAFWSAIQALSPIFALGLAAYLAYKKGLFTKATA
ncbi:hypothetical protein ACFS5N_13105 [Mucilaginibacter ximonensis]|uniref:Uncharacterized protein n=1 Tax=Mucilaginibacter ximonensis TaxID=538021 RepID=A0ABW5YDN5_9SPHI